MDNSVQMIKIEDIIPVENDPSSSEEINNLAESIKEYGIIEPLIVRPKDNKYEIISGKKRYQAALMAGQTDIPVLVRIIEKDFYKKNDNNQKKNSFINIKQKEDNINNNPIKNQDENKDDFELTLNKYKTSNNNDVINLSELNKEEYERDELNMNNEMINNQPMQPEMQNNVQQNSAPTFGGRFFPSLEDEPTNMNMGGNNIIGEQPINQMPPTPMNNISPTNNLIDLTETNNEPENQMMMPQQSFQPEQQQFNSLPEQPMPEMNQPAPLEQQQYNPAVNQPMPEISQPMQSTTPAPEPMLDSFSNSDFNQVNMPEENMDMNQFDNQMANPIQQPYQANDEMMPQIDNGMPQMNQEPEIPEFDMSQSVGAPSQPMDQQSNNMNMNQNNFELPTDPVSDFSNQPMQPEMPQMYQNNPMPEQPMPMPNNYNELDNNMQQNVVNINPMSVMPDNNSFEMNQPMQAETTMPSINIEPVLNTIKSLANNLKEFGYDIQINEEDLGVSSKLIIEIKK